ncbi:hypothetical protein PI124_g16128 [Phytophthora idaei]|nr:hypothetical protein PI125_g16507 [Phytophthora idaei]KAG3238923.1 hypothetical protein PI124_g16128 [Phytophthora idaei]
MSGTVDAMRLEQNRPAPAKRFDRFKAQQLRVHYSTLMDSSDYESSDDSGNEEAAYAYQPSLESHGSQGDNDVDMDAEGGGLTRRGYSARNAQAERSDKLGLSEGHVSPMSIAPEAATLLSNRLVPNGTQ